MAHATVDPPSPKAPTPKVRAMREIMRAFGNLALNNDLIERNSFRTLFNIIEDAVVCDRLMRSLYVELLRGGRIELQVRFIINWQRKVVTVESGKSDSTTVMLSKGAESAQEEEFMRIVSPKLYELHSYVQRMIVEGEYDEANWTVELRDNDPDKDVVRRCRAVERKYGLVEPSPEYLEQRRELEASRLVKAAFNKKSLKELLLRIIHRQ